MNFLAHAYLSFGDADILIGNMIADLVKGKQIDLYPESIQRGIKIHRQIDAYTDNHIVIRNAVEIYRSSAKRYAGPFLDVSYDHFLALDTQNEPVEGWRIFADKCYAQIEEYAEILPAQFCSMFLYMKSEDWFYNYRYNWMIERSFERLKRRANYLDDDAPIFAAFEDNYKQLEDSYNAFFRELKIYVEEISLIK